MAEKSNWNKKDYVALANVLVDNYHDYRLSKPVRDTMVIHKDVKAQAFEHFLQDNLAFASNCIRSKVSMPVTFESAESFDFNFKVMNVEPRGDRRFQSGEYLVLSPIFEAKESHLYCHLCQTSNFESITTRLYLVEKNKKGEIKVLKDLDSYTAYY